MQRATIFLACFIAWSAVSAQQYPFVHYTPREGLANNRARFIFQDSKGKLYISTYGGMSIYDGTRFVNYNTHNGLAAGLVNDFVEMGEDSIWIVPNANKIHCLVKGRLKDFIPTDNFVPIINQLVKCSDGFYYALSDEGLFRFENRRFKKIELNSLPNKEFGMALLDGMELDKKLFILSNPGFTTYYSPNLIVYDLITNKVHSYKSDIKASAMINPTGKGLWFATLNGLFLVDNESITDTSIVLKSLHDSLHIPRDVVALQVFRDRQGNVWLTTGKGIYRIKENGEKILFTTENGLTTNYQSSILQDYENNMWFTNEQTGLSKLSNQQLAYYPSLMPGFNPTDINIRTASDSVWFYDGYNNRILIILPDGRREEFSGEKLAPNVAGFISADGEFILSGQNIYLINYERDRKRYTLKKVFFDSTVTGFNFPISDGKGGFITVSWKLFVWTGKKMLSHPLPYIGDQVALDKNGRIWTATRSNHLLCFEVTGSGDNVSLKQLNIKLDSLPRISPRSIAADKSGNIWIGTRDHGLFCFRFDGLVMKSFDQLTTQNGLSENFVKYLFCDKDDNIWACTPSGLDKVRMVNNQFHIDNLTRSNNLYFPIYKVQETANGDFWVLSAAGIINFNLFRPTMMGWKPRLEFSDIVISNAREMLVYPGKKLRHFQNNMTFNLSSPTFIDEKQTRFSYFLEGSGNESWSEPSTNASINFVNLPPGEYTLRAKAIFLHGLYPDIVSSFSFEILPPWWQTWWFRISLVLVALILVWLALRYYIARKLELQRAILEKKQAIEKERTRIATDMHDDLGAGLSRIKFLSETIGMKRQKHMPIEEEIDSIRTYSHDMIDKMGEIVWALNEKNDTLNDLLSYTRSYSAEYLAQNGISCHIEEPDNIPQHEVSGEFRRNIYLTVKEALHNIVKHAEATEVSINIDIIGDQLSIIIKDNGKGLADDRIRSFGNGLINMEKRIQELKGRFVIRSENGTMVDILVPLNHL